MRGLMSVTQPTLSVIGHAARRAQAQRSGVQCKTPVASLVELSCCLAAAPICMAAADVHPPKHTAPCRSAWSASSPLPPSGRPLHPVSAPPCCQGILAESTKFWLMSLSSTHAYAEAVLLH